MAGRQTEEYSMPHIAANIRAARLLYRVDVVARVESEEDIDFWRYMFHRAKPGLKVKFLPSDSGVGTDCRQRGKSVCMRYVGHLDRHLIICVDSDFDSFTRPEVLTVEKYVFQTYTYSVENHHCWAEGLQAQWHGAVGGAFDFKVFLTGFSRILYPVLIEMLSVKSAMGKSWSLTELCGVILSTQVNRSAVLKNNGELLLREIADRVNAWRDVQPPPAKAELDNMQVIASRQGLSCETAYLYMQGHCVYNLCDRVGTALCYGFHNFEFEVLRQSLRHCDSEEFRKVMADLKAVYA